MGILAKENPNHDEHGRFSAGSGERVGFQSAGAQRGTGAGHANRLTPEEEASARTRSEEYQARLKERLRTRVAEPKPVTTGGERVGFRSLGTNKGVFDMPKRIMREFALFEVSAVDRPCQEGARMVIAKRAENPAMFTAEFFKQCEMLPEALRMQVLKGTICPECGGKDGVHKGGCSLSKAAQLAICKECGGDGMHLEKCSMYGKAKHDDEAEDKKLIEQMIREHEGKLSKVDLSSFTAYLKREFSAEERRHAASSGAAMPGGGFPIESESDLHNAIRAIGRAKNPAAARAHIKQRAKALGLSSAIPDTWKVAPALEQFQPLLKLAAAYDAPPIALAPIYAAIVKAAPDIDALPEGERTETLDGLMTKCAERLAKIVPSGSVDAFKAAVAAKGAGDMDPKDIEKLQKRAAFLELLAKASDAVKAFMAAEKMDDAAQAAFLAKSAEEQAKAIKAKKKGKEGSEEEEASESEAEAEAEGDTKKAIKKRDAVIAELTKDLNVLKAKDELAICKELCRKAGVAEGKAEHLMKLRKLDAAIAEDTLKEWSAAAKQTNPMLFAELGKGGGAGDFSTPYEELCAKAQELVNETKKADPKSRITIEKAKSAIYEDPHFSDLAKRHKDYEMKRRLGRAA